MLKLKSDEIIDQGKQIEVISRNPQPDFPEHNHDFSELVLIKSGIGSHIINGNISNLLPFSISSISDKDYHQFYETEGLNLTNIVYKKESISISSPVANIVQRFEKYSNGIYLTESEFSLLYSISEQMKLEQINSNIHSQYMTSLLFEKLWISLDRIQHSRPANNEVMLPVIYMCNHYKDSTLTINEVCDSFSISAKRLAKLTFEVSGLNPAKFLNSLRIREAKLLLSRGKSVTDVAMSVGFGDSNYFSTKFKTIVGCTPREFTKKPI